MQNTHQGRNPKPEAFFFWQWSQGSWQRLFAQVFTEFNAFRTGLGYSRLPQCRFYAKNPVRCTNTILQNVHRIDFILDHGLHYEWIKCWILFGFYADDRTANLWIPLEASSRCCSVCHSCCILSWCTSTDIGVDITRPWSRLQTGGVQRAGETAFSFFLKLAIFFKIARKCVRDLPVGSVDVNTACKRLWD